MDKIMEIALKYDIPMIEDAAEALGSKFKGNKLELLARWVYYLLTVIKL